MQETNSALPAACCLLHTSPVGDFLQTLITAVTLGSLYALIALGYTMVYGVLKLINFAHSDIVVLGAWLSVLLASFLLPQMGVYLPEAPWWAGLFVLILTMAICGAVGFGIERLAYKPIRKAPRLNALITAIGVSLFLQNAGQLQYSVVDAQETQVAKAKMTDRVAADRIKLDKDLTLDTAGTFKLRFYEPGKTDGSQDREPRLKPGTYAAGHEIQLDRGVPTRFAGGEVAILRTNLPLRFPFGARPASMPKVLPDEVLTGAGAAATQPADQKFLEFMPRAGVVLQMNFYREFPGATPHAATQRVHTPVKLRVVDLIIIVTAIALMVVLQFLVFHTRIGTAMRAVSYNMETATLMGIPVDRVVSFTFVTGTMLAAAAGFLYALKYSVMLQPAASNWVLLGLKAFVAAVVGGIGNIRGAVVGGFLIAFLEQFGQYTFPAASAFTDVFVFVLLIVVLLVKPTGIFGTTVREKV